MTNKQVGILLIILGIAICIISLIIKKYDNVRKYKYNKTVNGKVVGHKWHNLRSVSYPYAIVEYTVDNQTYMCPQKFSVIYRNTLAHAKNDWEIDKNYALHIYRTSKCENHIDPIKDLFPIGSTLEVHYMEDNPNKAYCGSLINLKLFFLILGIDGLSIICLGILFTILF